MFAPIFAPPQEAYGRANEFQLNDSAVYYFEAISRIQQADYTPTEQVSRTNRQTPARQPGRGFNRAALPRGLLTHTVILFEILKYIIPRAHVYIILWHPLRTSHVLLPRMLRITGHSYGVFVSPQDVLRARVRTTGVIETSFKFKVFYCLLRAFGVLLLCYGLLVCYCLLRAFSVCYCLLRAFGVWISCAPSRFLSLAFFMGLSLCITNGEHERERAREGRGVCYAFGQVVLVVLVVALL